MADSNIENKKVFTNRQLIWILGGALSASTAVTMIYSKFLFNDQQLQINKAKIEEVENKHDEEIRDLRSTMYRTVNAKFDEVNSRMDRKSERIIKSVSESEEEIEELQKDLLILKTKQNIKQ